MSLGALFVFSILTPLENVMQSILDFFHGSVGLPWAWSIVALTILTRIVLVPLTVRQIHSMQSLQAHAPEMKAIQQKYKGDRAKLNEELMKFYKENNINPAASCLPLLAQFPVFIALYFTLKHGTKHIHRARGCTSSRTSPTRRPRTGRASCCSRSTPARRSPRPTSWARRWTRRSGRS